MSAAKTKKQFKSGMKFGLLAGYVIFQQAWALGHLFQKDPQQTLAAQKNLAPKGLTFSKSSTEVGYNIEHTVEDGIERISYIPKKRRHETPIVLQHGMWHGAWCWQFWQEILAQNGWESHAHSLPGHAGSPTQRPIARCTLDYYLSFLKREMERYPTRPVLIGHSMGGALAQWYFKYVRDDLPAAVLVAPWVSHSMMRASFLKSLAYDPLGALLMLVTWDSTPLKRAGAGSAVRFLVGPDAAMPLDQLQPKLGSESALVLYQHNAPFWTPPEQVNTPLLWIAGEDDPLLVEADQRRSAAHYRADYIVAAHARHNVMHEHNYRETATQILAWLEKQDID